MAEKVSLTVPVRMSITQLYRGKGELGESGLKIKQSLTEPEAKDS